MSKISSKCYAEQLGQILSFHKTNKTQSESFVSKFVSFFGLTCCKNSPYQHEVSLKAFCYKNIKDTLQRKWFPKLQFSVTLGLSC